MKKKIIYCAIIMLFLVSCKKQVHEYIETIDLSNVTDSTFMLSEIADSIVYYPLPSIKSKTYTTEIEVLEKFIYSFHSHHLYKYERKSLQLLDSIYLGGPMEGPGYTPFKMITNTAFPFGQDELFICPRRTESGNNDYYSSATLNTSTKKWQDNITFPNYDFTQINEYITDFGYCLEKTIFRIDTLKWFDKNMQCLKEEILDTVLTRPYPGPKNCITLLHDKIYYHAPTSSTIYEISPKHAPIPLYKFRLGKYQTDYKEFSDFQFGKVGHYRENAFNHSPHYHLRGAQISEQFIWGTFHYKGNLFGFLFNKTQKGIHILPVKAEFQALPIEEGGLTNDLDGGMDFWPRRISKKGEIYTWYDVEDLKYKVSQSRSDQIKNPEAAKRLKKMLDNLPENIRTIIAVLKEKNNSL